MQQPDQHLQALGRRLTAAGSDRLLISDATNGMAQYITVQDLLTGGASNINLPDDTELTISSGAITVTQSTHRVDTASDAATDDLATINMPANVNVAWLKAENAGRVVTVKHGTGNIRVSTGSDFILPPDVLIPFVRDGLLTTVIDPVPSGTFTNHLHTQSVASSLWTINHSLGRIPTVEVRDASGNVILAEVNHVSANQATVSFAAAQTGSAYCV